MKNLWKKQDFSMKNGILDKVKAENKAIVSDLGGERDHLLGNSLGNRFPETFVTLIF